MYNTTDFSLTFSLIVGLPRVLLTCLFCLQSRRRTGNDPCAQLQVPPFVCLSVCPVCPRSGVRTTWVGLKHVKEVYDVRDVETLDSSELGFVATASAPKRLCTDPSVTCVCPSLLYYLRPHGGYHSTVDDNRRQGGPARHEGPTDDVLGLGRWSRPPTPLLVLCRVSRFLPLKSLLP